MTSPLSARLRRAWFVLGAVLSFTVRAAQDPVAPPEPEYDLDTKALLLARTYLKGGEDSGAALREALQLMGWGVRDLKGALISAPPAGTDTGLAMRDYELTELLFKPGEQPSVRLISFAQALAVPFENADAEEIAQDIVTSVRDSAASTQPQRRFWGQFIAALGRGSPADYDRTKPAPPAVIPFDKKRVERMARENPAELMQNPLQ